MLYLRTNMLIMKKFFIFLAAMAAAFCLYSCNEDTPYTGIGRVVIVYMSADNSLSKYAEYNYDSMLEGYLPSDGTGEHLLVFLHTEEIEPVLVELSRDKDGNPVKREVYRFDVGVSASAECVNTVLTYVKDNYPSENYGLILWSHSTGWLPERYYEEGAPSGYADPSHAPREATDHTDVYGDAIVKMAVPEISTTSFGQDSETGREIDIVDLSGAIPMHLDFLIFDSCLMGCVEVAYQFRNIADYFCASPTEVLANGFPYTHIMDPLFRLAADAAVKEVADLYFYYYAASSSPYATISVVDCSKLDNLASACKAVFDENRDKVPSLDMSSIQPYFRMNKHWFYDLADFIGELGPSAPLMEDFSAAMKEAVIFKEATERFISFDITEFCGLSTYIQNPEEPYLDEYYRGLDWNTATGMIAD